MELSVKCNNVEITVTQDGDQITIVAMNGDDKIEELVVDCTMDTDADADINSEEEVVNDELDAENDDEMTELDSELEDDDALEQDIMDDEDEDESVSESAVMDFESFLKSKGM